MKNSDRLFITAFGIALLVNLAAAAAWQAFPLAGWIALITIIIGTCAWILLRLVQNVLGFVRFGRYAVLVFFLNRQKKLLLIKHPYHNVLLPPGGRLRQWELPHDAVARVLKEEACIDEHQFEFHPLFHEGEHVISEIVQSVPRPYSVHMERRQQRGWLHFHYAFVYVCRYRQADRVITVVPQYAPRWYSLKEIESSAPSDRPFDDIIRRYEELLSK
jgi:ADP-ribose pyrophosphatase YjhB (NUDIX family)